MKLRAWIGLRAACMMIAAVLFIGCLPVGVKAAEAAPYSIHAGNGPHAIAVNIMTNKVYAANADSDSVTVIDDNQAPGSAAVAATVETGTTPYALAVNPLTDKIYVANADSDNVTVIDGATNGTITIPAGTKPFAVAVNEGTNKIYVANIGSDDVTVIDGVTNETVTIPAGKSPFDIAVDRVSNKIYVANVDSDTVTVIDGTSNTAVSIPTGAGPNALAVDTATGRVYVANFFSNNVTVIEGATVTTTVPAGLTPNAVAVNEATGKIYVANDNGNSVTVIDRTDHSTSTVSVGKGPSALAVNSNTNTIYAANYDSHDVSVINGADHTTSTVPVGKNPIAIAVNAGIGKSYAANFNGGSISVIEESRTNPSASANLSALTLSEGVLSPAFNPSIDAYTVNVDNTVSQIVVTAATYDLAASLSVTGNVYGNVMSIPIDLQLGANELSITVRAADEQTSKTYRISIYRKDIDQPEQPVLSSNADLNQLTVSAGVFQPAFHPSVFAYEMEVGNGVTTVSVTASTYDAGATMRINGQLHNSGVPFAVNLQTGVNPISIATTAEDELSNRTYMLTVRRAENVQPPYNPPEESREPEVLKPKPDFITEGADGLTLESGAAEWKSTTAENGQSVLTGLLHADVLAKAFGKLEGKSPSSQKITFAMTGQGIIRKAGIPANVLKAAAIAVPNAVLSIKTDNASYDLPVNLPALTAILEQLGDDLDDAVVYVSMETVTGDTAKRVEAQAQAFGARVISDIIDFILTVEAKDRTLTVSDFGNTYVARSILLPGTIDPAGATAVLFELQSGTVSFVPSVFAASDKDETLVTLLRPGNSLYAVVESRKSFTDVREHWAKAEIELLASKLVVNGMTETSFVPERPVTRAEFAGLLVRALGLREDPASAKPFRDTAPEDWFAGAVGAASKADIVDGFEDNTFRPDETITREQMAVMMLRALRFTGQHHAVVGKQNSVLAAFDDHEEISAWAKASVEQIVQAGLMNGVTSKHFAPNEHATRAEAAVVVKRLLQAAAFIN
ncbi:S-layer homology domain-containing protein [Paenibacillus contaminans]|uniref:SLH domain-containing protein n=1 Tax=Paenibacillus contaminans TaxID=450362 RepID=A0A329MN94_9BACL|nr:S-layer homology domain-containing protein [Paenibacillus contaminans]RAV21050.1 hypothetical protein DQG23_13285 [Paenibacillus contaminans]